MEWWKLGLVIIFMFISYLGGFAIGFKRGHQYCFYTLMEELKKKLDEENKDADD